jgi:hypothetical protein
VAAEPQAILLWLDGAPSSDQEELCGKIPEEVARVNENSEHIVSTILRLRRIFLPKIGRAATRVDTGQRLPWIQSSMRVRSLRSRRYSIPPFRMT